MVKYITSISISPPHKFKIPIKVIIFWYKKISSYINSRKLSLIENKECPTIYISKRYPKMSIIELYERISHHLSKYFPSLYHKLNSNKKNCLIKIKKVQNDSNLKTKEEKYKLSNNEIKPNKNFYVLIKNTEKNEHTEKIKRLNEKKCEKLKHLFEPHKFENDILEKYNNCTIKEILLRNNDNENDNESSSSSYSIIDDDDISPCKSVSSTSSNSSTINKINYLVHFSKAPRKSKYFDNDDYYSNKLKSVGYYNNNK